MRTTIARVLGALRALVRRAFCHHEWVTLGSRRFDVLKADNSKEGSVTLNLLECRKCQAEHLYASDRTHAPNGKAQSRTK
jgi:hypothetical protein